MISLIFPNLIHEEQVMDYRNEFLINHDSMDGTAGLRDYEDYVLWLERIKNNNNRNTRLDGLVPATTLLVIRESDDYLVGMVDIRHELNDYLYNYGGHIGYSVRRSERRQGYATELLRLTLRKCKELALDKTLVCCNKDNIASARTIMSNGGVLENEVIEDGELVQRYWIKC
ncbi:GNAT family N-acetyltransferase [Vallitalea sediminicola]